MSADRIEKRVLLRASREQVWQAVSDPAQFGSWFGVTFDGPFTAGSKITGRIVPTMVDAEIAKLQEPHTGMPFEFWVERIEPMNRIRFRWHPYAVDGGVDYSTEPTTLITFDLEDAPGGIMLTISESGFEQIPLDRRAAAFKANEGGWSLQTRLITQYLALQA
jgi:uncharacterized protein YndB with AHSA1/START domain